MIAVAWLLLLGLLTLLFNNFLEQENNPNQSPTTTTSNTGTKEVVLKRNRAGHYLANGKINGHPVIFLLDTGATDVALPEKLANRLGLEKGYEARAQTANGIARSYMTLLKHASIGEIRLYGIRASILPGMKGNQVLLGMSFLKQLEMRQKGDTLTLIQN
ncbi:MAG: TIGR02281 family clan AA aspartic protease [Gammaproteobacteria bacterium]|nr:TIGR02281 family clan AA aspartic protease [Gammaproteobacteria bacterium]